MGAASGVQILDAGTLDLAAWVRDGDHIVAGQSSGEPQTLTEALAWLADIDVCYAPLRTLKESMQDPNTTARGMLLHDEAGNAHLGVPVKFRHEPAQPVLRAPELGEHSRAVLARAGVSAAEIDELARANVI